MSPDIRPDSDGGRRLESWKEIASYLRRTVRTVQRWEREQGLPVHRLHHNRLPTIYAYPHELDAWWAQRGAIVEGDERMLEPAPADEDRSGALAAAAMPLDTNPAPATTNQDVSGIESTRSLPEWRLVAVVALSLVLGGLATWILLGGASSADASRNDQHPGLLVQRGRQFLNKRTPNGFREALRTFEHALQQDPSNAAAYSGLADAYTLMQAFGVMKKTEALPRARAAAERALEFDARSGAAQASMSLVLWEEGRHADAIAAARQAIAADPRYPTARHWYALYLYGSGRYVEGINEVEVAARLDPLSPIIVCDQSLMLRAAGRAPEARGLLESALAAHPTFAQLHVELSEVSRQLGDYGRALEHIAKAIDYGDDRPVIVARLAWLEAQNGNAPAAVAALRRVKAAAASGGLVPPAAMAEALVAGGDLSAAFDLVEQATSAGDVWVLQVTTDPLFGALRRDSRWPAVHTRLLQMSDRLRTHSGHALEGS